jgi:thiamine-phosphate pyrophosphorylase
LPRARLYLVTPRILDPIAFAPVLAEALAAGDVASLLIAPEVTSEAALQRIAETLVPIAQKAGVAALVVDDSRAVGRSKADGIHVEAGPEALSEALDGFHPNGIVGAGNLRTRHEAMAAAEAGADYVFFGLLDRPDDEQTHRKTLDLGSWWADLFEPPCVVLAGSDLASVTECAETGADFVALRGAAWDHPAGAAEAVREANALLDAVAAAAKGKAR